MAKGKPVRLLVRGSKMRARLKALGIKATIQKPKTSKLRGFAYMKRYEPEKLAAIAQAAGKRAQKLHGKRIRWSKKKATAMAAKGGRARWKDA